MSAKPFGESNLHTRWSARGFKAAKAQAAQQAKPSAQRDGAYGSAHDAPFAGLAILLVDDDVDCRTLLRDAIAECKVDNQVFEVSDGVEALEFLRKSGKYAGMPRPGLIYLDIEMPRLDGHATLKAIKDDPALRDIPIVMMTGVSDEEQMKRTASAGANSYTLKPANAEQFLRTVLASTNYWLTIHQYPGHHLPACQCRK